MKKLLTLLTFAACLATAQQYTFNFAAPAGAIQCAHTSPYQQHYWLVENSTPPYPGDVPTGSGFHMPAFPNHPLLTPVGNICAGRMAGFVSTSGAKAILEMGNGIGWFRITAADGTQQAVEVANAVWTWPATYPAEGESVEFDMTAQIINVCNAICEAATGQLNFTSHFHFNWKIFPPSGCGSRGGCATQVAKLWTDDDAVIDGQSTVPVLN